TIGLHLEELYTKASGLDLLIDQNKSAKLSAVQPAEFSAKVQTRAALTTFAIASYIVWDLSAYRTEEVSNVVMTVDAPDGINFASTQEAIRSTLFYFGKGVQEEGKVDNDPQFVKFALLYFRHIIDAVKLRETGLKCKEPFTDRRYKLDDCDFVIDGFEVFCDRSVVSVEFNKVLDRDIIGNREAKHAALRVIHWMLCYNPLTKVNPVVKFGAFPFICMGYGEPGTGKSMLIGYIATKLDEYCKWLEIPFLFHPFPSNIISTFQGGSAERMTDWMRPLRDPTKIIYAPIDDAENVFRHRGRENASEGERGVSSVFLPGTEGATAPRRGNTLTHLMTNRPGDIDSAILSRVTSRFPIKGAQTVNDHMDQDYLDSRRYAEINPNFFNLEPPPGYTYLADQRSVASLTELAEKYFEPKEERIRVIFDEVRKKYNSRQHRFFGTLDRAVQDVFPGYTSRDKRNIYTAVSGRIMDFDFPSDWFVDPKTFFKKKPDEERTRMLTELMKANMGTLTYADIRLEETLRYLDNMVAIADKDREAKIEALVKDAEIREEAAKRFKARK
ncbi:MAG: AAA family ATPase, partial [Patescibacteria group bacterium]